MPRIVDRLGEWCILRMELFLPILRLAAQLGADSRRRKSVDAAIADQRDREWFEPIIMARRFIRDCVRR